MGRPRQYDSPASRRAAEMALRKVRRDARPGGKSTVFRGVDGEGTGHWRSHQYQMLSVADVTLFTPGVHLDWKTIFSFLYDQFDPGFTYCGFFLGYDFNQWFRTLPSGRAAMLLTEEGALKRKRKKGIMPFPVRFDGWEFDILAMKRFKLRPQSCDCPKWCKHKAANPWMFINDAGSFFQTSFLKVIDPEEWTEPVCTPDEFELIKAGKARRGAEILTDLDVEYNRLENDVLARVLGRLDTGFREMGVFLHKDQWFGPGQAAQGWMRGTELPRKGDLDMESLQEPLDWGRKAYYGGWFEIMAHGHVPGVTFEYDINSAYPYVSSRLPCIMHGTWEKRVGSPVLAWNPDEHDRNETMSVVCCRVSGSDRRIGAMLHRHTDGRIARPWNTGGYYWRHELAAACHAGLISDVEVFSEYSFYQECRCRPPMAGLEGLYWYRLRVGKNTPEGKAAKLVYNSVYGKNAQSEGEPQFANAIYASLITAGCRTMILDAIATHPRKSKDVVMVATDGIYFRSPHPGLPVSNRLGEWDVHEKENLTLFKPGVYWDDRTRDSIRRGNDPVFKARGISAKAFSTELARIDREFGRWGDTYPHERDPDGERDGWFPRVKFTSGFSMISCKQALQRDQWYLAGAVQEDKELVQDSDPVSKRHSGTFEDGVYWSRPHRGWSYEPDSIPYDKRFGREMREEKEDTGWSPDGLVSDLYADVLRAGG